MVDVQLGMPFAAKKFIDGVPRNGVNKLLRDCHERVDDAFSPLPPHARFALVDGDKLHEELGLPGTSSLDERRAALQRAYPGVRMFTPDAANAGDSNTEALLQDVASCFRIQADDHNLQIALRKKRGALNARDSVFARAAYSHNSSAIAEFRLRQPSIAQLVDELAKLVLLHQSSEPP
ncbi:MAG: hypothetical protein R3B48_28010 [Kofleriaceae bacterium]